ncbi:hypothetical protein BGZ88_003394 [Linnemannia elongata]|nr:hypothetical protein BGZ88_003394 [Linnemannia elongata]
MLLSLLIKNEDEISNFGDGPKASHPVFGCRGGVMASSARFGYGSTILPSDHSTFHSMKQSNAHQVATCLTYEEFLNRAVFFMGETDNEQHNFTTTVKDTTSVQDKTIEQENSTSPAFILALLPQGIVTSTSAPAPTAVSRRRIRFDPKPPSIKILALNRVKGPPKLPGEESMDIALKRAGREYQQDSELRQEFEMAKRESLNTTEERVNKKHAINNGDTKECLTEECLADELAAKKTRVVEGTSCESSSGIFTSEHSYSTTKHSTNIKKHALDDSIYDHNTLDYRSKKRRAEYNLTTQSSPNNNATTDRQDHENSASSNNETTITIMSGLATDNLAANNQPTMDTVTSKDPATHSHKHPEFDGMIMNNKFGKVL